MNDVIAGVLLVGLFFGPLVWWEVSVWNECRATNSWFYCLRMISR